MKFRGIIYPVGLYVVGILISSWGYFYPKSPFWQYMLLSALLIPTYWLLKKMDNKHTGSQNELENTIKLLEQSESGYSKLIEFLPVPAIAHSFGIITYVNRATLKVLGKENIDEIISRPIFELIHSDNHAALKRQFQGIRYKATDEMVFEECVLIGAGDRKISVESSSMLIQLDDYKMTLTVFHDITYRRNEQELMRNMAYVCQLTQLVNRRYFEEMLNKKINDSFIKNNSFYILFIDLDGFKMVNDKFGHAGGDEVLQIVAQRLTDCVRNGDVVSRYAGDEFIVFLSEVQLEEAVDVAKRIITTMGKLMLINDETVSVTASIGISCYPKDAENAVSLIKLADKAMYSAKKKGKNNYKVYQSS